MSTATDPTRAPRTGVFTIYVNDKPRPLGAGATVIALLRDLGLAERKGIAVAINNNVVPRAAWTAQSLTDGDRVLLIHATQGG